MSLRTKKLMTDEEANQGAAEGGDEALRR